MKMIFDQYAIDLTPNGKNYKALSDNKSIDVEIIHIENGRLDLLLDGKHIIAYLSSDGVKRWVTLNGRTFILTKSANAKPRIGTGHDHASELVAPMPGQVRSINVKEGDTVNQGQTLLVLEAMKMEIRIQAPRNGRIKALHVKQGQTVEREQVLIEMEEK